MTQEINKNSDTGAPVFKATNDLVPIDAAYFYSGMYVDFSIYTKNGAGIELLCNNVLLNDDLIGKFDQIEDSGGFICISTANYKRTIFNAAAAAAANGIQVDWDVIRRTAENPPTFENPVRLSIDSWMNKDQLKEKEPAPQPAASPAPEKSMQPEPAVPEKPPIPQAAIINTLNTYLDTYGDSVPEETAKEVHEAIDKLQQYFAITEGIQEIIKYSAKNYTVRPKEVNEVAGQIVEIVTSTKPEIIMQCMSSLTAQFDYLPAHTQNVASMNVLLGSWMDLPWNDIRRLAVTGILHDLGKLIISNKIIQKPSRLSAQEFEAVKKHPVHSYNIALSSGITNRSILLGIRHHHERIHGTGYPDAIKTPNISQFASITAISDMYDAMTTGRSYKEDFSPFDVMQEFSELRFTDLDLKIVNMVLDNMINVLMNKRVRLSNGKNGLIAKINPSDYAHPTVYVDNKYVKTSNSVKVMAINTFIPLG
ncbi:MAG: HD domain-containing protein [Firmicutes bacterium]|nr:HD domain-containing protein [Bacillota bacterium]